MKFLKNLGDIITEMIKSISLKNFRQIDLKACDLFGKWYHVTISKNQLNRAAERGIGIDGSNYGFKGIKSSDMLLFPDLKTAVRDPFYEIPTLSIICNIKESNGSGSPLDPRSVAKRALSQLSGFSPGKLLVSPELEFFAIKSDKSYPQLSQSYYHAIPPKDYTSNFRSQVVRLMEEMGYKWKYHHSEVAFGQVEIEVPLATLVKAADGVMTARYIIENVAKEYGLKISFAPKPKKKFAGSGMHVHQYLARRGRSLFYDSKGSYAFLSQLALCYIGGLLKHTPALCAFTNPAPESYQRLVPGFEAPTKLFYSLGDRSAAIRIPAYALYSDELRIEYRPPDATCNIYLTLAAMLMAGIDGIINRLDPIKEGFGPETPKRKLKSLPTSVEEAKEALRKDHQFLLHGGVFSEELIAVWLNNLRMM